MDLVRWKEKYSFLEKVSDLFEEYNDDITEESDGRYGPCMILTYREGENRTKYEHFCRKLIRNIWIMSELTEEDMEKPVRLNRSMTKNERCTNLYKWIYYYLIKVRVPEKMIEQIFYTTNKLIKILPHYYHCQYESINNLFIKPQYMVKLSFFGDNLHTISEILKEKTHRHYDACVKYIRECANTYKKMKKDHCTRYDEKDNKYVKTCAELQDFKSIYENELFKAVRLREKLPELDAQITAAEEKILLEQEQKEQEEYNAAQNGFLSGSLQRNLSTGAVAAAGTGALLLALNKFTPARKIFRSGKRRTPEVENILEEGPSEELFINDQDYMHMNSDTMSYNVGYGSTENY